MSVAGGAAGGEVTMDGSLLLVLVVAVAEVRAEALCQLGHGQALGLLGEFGSPVQP
jgi:hypothetical protein